MRDRLIELPIDDAILILKEEHKQRVDGYTTHLSYGGKGDPAEEAHLDALEMAISALEQTKWISVKDRLPTIYDADADNCVLAIHKASNKRYYHWRSVADNPFDFTHWMKTPQPPKGE